MLLLSSLLFLPCPSQLAVSEMQPSLAGEIPEELFEQILWYACVCDENREFELGDKLSISTFGQVNRYWALLCRRELFRSITLRCLDDVHHFRDILTTPTLPGLEPVSGMVHWLRTMPRSEDPPWLHLVFIFIIPIINAELYPDPDVQPVEQQMWRTFPPSLPRSIPGSIMLINELQFNGVQFPSRRKFSRLLSSVPHLNSLYAFNLTFIVDSEPESSANDVFTTPFTRRLGFITTDDLCLCFAVMPSLLLCPSKLRYHLQKPVTSGGRRSRPSRQLFDEDDLDTLWDMFNIFHAARTFAVRRTSANDQGYSISDGKCYTRS